MRIKYLFFLGVLAAVVGVSVAIWRGVGPLADPEGCSATVAGREVDVDPEQGRIVTLIAAVADERDLPPRAVTIAIATAYQESKISNIDYGDRDSVGIFQQRPSQGWGRRAQILDEHYSINKFFEALEKLDGYEDMVINDAAQAVQRSGHPNGYDKHESNARVLASAATGETSGGAFTCVVDADDDRGTQADVAASLTEAFGDITVNRGARQDTVVPVRTTEAGLSHGWTVAQYLMAHADGLKLRSVSFDGRIWQVGRDSEKGWTPSPSARSDQVVASLG